MPVSLPSSLSFVGTQFFGCPISPAMTENKASLVVPIGEICIWYCGRLSIGERRVGVYVSFQLYSMLSTSIIFGASLVYLELLVGYLWSTFNIISSWVKNLTVFVPFFFPVPVKYFQARCTSLHSKPS